MLAHGIKLIHQNQAVLAKCHLHQNNLTGICGNGLFSGFWRVAYIHIYLYIYMFSFLFLNLYQLIFHIPTPVAQHLATSESDVTRVQTPPGTCAPPRRVFWRGTAITEKCRIVPAFVNQIPAAAWKNACEGARDPRAIWGCPSGMAFGMFL